MRPKTPFMCLLDISITSLLKYLHVFVHFLVGINQFLVLNFGDICMQSLLGMWLPHGLPPGGLTSRPSVGISEEWELCVITWLGASFIPCMAPVSAVKSKTCKPWTWFIDFLKFTVCFEFYFLRWEIFLLCLVFVLRTFFICGGPSGLASSKDAHLSSSNHSGLLRRIWTFEGIPVSPFPQSVSCSFYL